ncbi:MAG: type II secretion system protein GspG [Phycisphaerales bacterium]
MSHMPSGDFAFEEPRSQSNTLGLVGFILAFCVSPLGLILSLIALFKAPRGFAIAGVVIGLIGTALWVVIGSGIFFVANVAMKSKQLGDKMTLVQTALETAKTPEGAYPADISGIAAGADTWGKPFVYERTPDTKGYLLSSNGADGQAGTDDDIFTTQTVPGDANVVIAAFGMGTEMVGAMGGGMVGKSVQVGARVWLITLALDSVVEKGTDYPAKLEDIAGLSPKLLVDPWGTPFVYTPAADGKSYQLRSNGPDTQPGTGDDVDSKQVTGQFEQARARSRAQQGGGGGNP